MAFDNLSQTGYERTTNYQNDPSFDLDWDSSRAGYERTTDYQNDPSFDLDRYSSGTGYERTAGYERTTDYQNDQSFDLDRDSSRAGIDYLNRSQELALRYRGHRPNFDQNPPRIQRPIPGTGIGDMPDMMGNIDGNEQLLKISMEIQAIIKILSTQKNPTTTPNTTANLELFFNIIMDNTGPDIDTVSDTRCTL